MRLKEIIEEQYSMSEIEELYNQQRINEAEYLLLSSLEDELYFKGFLLGIEPYKLSYDTSVDENLYFTNVDKMLKTFYSVYNKFPKYKIDKVFEFGLEMLSHDKYSMYQFLTILTEHLKQEKQGEAPFKIEAKSLLETTREILKNPILRQNFAKAKNYEASNRQNGYIDVFTDYNKIFKETVGIDIFDADEPETKKM